MAVKQIYQCCARNLSQSCKSIQTIESKCFALVMLAVIISNTVVMILETYDSYYQEYYAYFRLSEQIYLVIYTFECCLGLWIYSWTYFRNLWNSFNLFIVTTNIIGFVVQESIHNRTQSSITINQTQEINAPYDRINHFFQALRVLRVIRSFRALRVLRTIRFIESIHIIAKTCSKALPAMASIGFIMIIITCMSAIIARSLFGDVCPEKFGNLVRTLFSLFTLLTLDDWYSVYEVCAERDYTNFQLIFCLIYIFIINFILLNLLTAVLVDSFQQTLDNNESESIEEKHPPNADEQILDNLVKLTDEYCQARNLKDDKDMSFVDETINHMNQQNHLSNDDQTRFMLSSIMKNIKQYYGLMEYLEFLMERHELLTKSVQKSMQSGLLIQENRKMTTKNKLAS